MKRLRHGESCARQQKTHKSVPKSDPTGPRVWAPKLSALHMRVLAAQAAKKLDTAPHFPCEHHLSYLILSPSQEETLLLQSPWQATVFVPIVLCESDQPWKDKSPS